MDLHISENIRTYRKQHHMMQEQLAETLTKIWESIKQEYTQ